MGGQAHLADAFDHLFTAEHRYLLNVAIRCLEAIAGPATADPVRPILELDFDRMVAHPDRTAMMSESPRSPAQSTAPGRPLTQVLIAGHAISVHVRRRQGRCVYPPREGAELTPRAIGLVVR